MAIEKTDKISGDAVGWLLGAGLFAVTLASSLYYIDNRLQFSTAEQEKNVLLQRVRGAQAEINTGSVDPRQGASPSVIARRLNEIPAE